MKEHQRTARLVNMLKNYCRYGTDHSDIFMEKKRNHNIFFEDGVIEEISSSIQGGTGTRLICGDNVAYTHVTGRTEAQIKACLEVTAEKLGTIPYNEVRDNLENIDLLYDQGSFPPPDTQFLHKIDNVIRKRSNLVRQVTMGHDVSERDIMIIRSDSIITRETRKFTTFTVQVIVEERGQIQMATESMAFAMDQAEFWTIVDPYNIAITALERAITMLRASNCPAGKMPVVLGGKAGGTMIHEACGHGLEADIMQKDFSVYNNRVGEVVASPLVTLVDDGSLGKKYGSYLYDDEGNRSRRNVLIENGILKGQLTDYMSARRGGLPLSGNGRRSSYTNIPLPRMSNTFLLPGRTEKGDIVGNIEKGLYVRKMGGGEVDPTSGDFVFKVTEGYLISKGKITEPVRGALLIGNGPQVLMDINMVGNDLSFSPGVCGKSGQNVPVSDGQPTILISSLTVGGQDISDESF